jgi:hypothetical protein
MGFETNQIIAHLVKFTKFHLSRNVTGVFIACNEKRLFRLCRDLYTDYTKKNGFFSIKKSVYVCEIRQIRVRKVLITGTPRGPEKILVGIVKIQV